MSRPLQVKVAGSAARAIRHAAGWWKVNRTKAPDAFHEELTRALELIGSQPTIGARVRDVKLPGVRRLLLGRVRYHLYYRVAGNPPHVEVLALWHASRGSPPTSL